MTDNAPIDKETRNAASSNGDVSASDTDKPSPIPALLEAAYHYRKLGLKVLPLEGKNPNAKDWQRKSFDQPETRQRLSRAADPGIGVQMGPVSKLVDFEWDTEAQRKKFHTLFPENAPPVGPAFISKKGEHRLFAWDDRLNATGKANVYIPCDDGTKLIVRIGAAGLGSQSAFPPSSGKAWKLELSLDDCRPPPLPDELIDLLIAIANPTRNQPAPVCGATAACAKNGHATTVGAARKALALAAMRRLEVPEAENDGSNRKICACAIAVTHNLTDEEAIAVFRRYEQERPFPKCYSDEEICTGLRDAEQRNVRGAKLPQRVAKFTVAELCEDYPRHNPPVINGLIREGETCNIISHPKIGKSWFAYYVALCIIIGRMLFDRWATEQGKVLLIDNELHRSTLSQRIPAVAKAMGILAKDYENDFHVWPLRGDLRSLANLEDDFDAIVPGEYKLIILDAMYRFNIAGVSENDNAAMAAMYNLLDNIAGQRKAAIAVVHHTSKGAQGDKRVTDVGAGAGAQSRAADCHLILREHEHPNVVVLDAAVRSFPPVEPLALEWKYPLWQPAPHIDVSQVKGRGGAHAKKDREGMDAILAALAKGPLSLRKLRKAVPGHERLNRLLGELKSRGQVESFDTTKAGNKTQEYRLSVEKY